MRQVAVADGQDAGDVPATAPAGVNATGGGAHGEAARQGTGGAQGLDEWRDMSGNAVTAREARERGVHAQCSLASTRNLRRNPYYSRQRLAEHCVGHDYIDDIRCPDWPVLMEPILREGEVVKRVGTENVRAEEMGDFRAGVIILHGHVVCFHNDGDGGFRFYDNDSPERLAGVPQMLRADEMLDRTSVGLNPTIIGILQESSELSRRLGPAITTMFVRRAPPA